MKVCTNEPGLYGEYTEFLSFPPHMLSTNGGYYSTKDGCSIDICLVDEIKQLWSRGVHTMGCCCGHGIKDGYIQVLREADIQKMMELGYAKEECKNDCFIPKSKHASAR